MATGSGDGLGTAMWAGAIAAGSLAAWLWLKPALRWLVHEGPVTVSLLRTIDGRHALSLAWGLRRAARRLRRMLGAVHDDPSERHALALTLASFTGDDLAVILQRLNVLVETGDNDRIRALNRQLDEATQRWAALPESPERSRLDAEMAALRQEMEESRKTSRVWVALIRGMEETGKAMKALERDLALLGAAKTPHLPDFRRRLAEVSAHTQNLRHAHDELSSGR